MAISNSIANSVKVGQTAPTAAQQRASQKFQQLKAPARQPPQFLDVTGSSQPPPTPPEQTDPSPPPQPQAQTQTSGQDLIKTYKDMYEREAINAQARQAQNINAARLSAQQTAALAGYNPDMAERAMFEQTAGAYKSNQEIENELARFGLDVANKKYDVSKYIDERDYSRNIAAGMDWDPQTKTWSYAPQWEKEAKAQQRDYDYWKQQAEQGNEYAIMVKNYLDSQLGQGNQAAKTTHLENESYNLGLSLANSEDIATTISGMTDKQLRAALNNSNTKDDVLAAMNKEYPQFTSGRQGKAAYDDIMSQNLKAGQIIMLDGVPVKLTQDVSRSKTGGGRFDYHSRIYANIVGTSLLDNTKVSTSVSYIT